MHTLKVTKLTTAHFGPIDLEITGACITFLTGPSGAGKTLLLRAIANLDTYQGDVSLDHKSCSQIPPEQWRTKIAYIPTESHWWHNSVKPHFRLNHEIRTWASQLHLDENIFDRTIEQCSTGEKQRLALLRALQNQPTVLLLDEPTSSLDEENAFRVEQLIRHYVDDKHAMALWVSHNPQQRHRVAQRALTLKHGQLLEQEI